jgi:chromosome segregation ATPase
MQKKKVAIADTSIQNIERAIHQVDEEQLHRDQQIIQLEEQIKTTTEQLAAKTSELESLQQQQANTKEPYSAITIGTRKFAGKTGGRKPQTGLKEK